MAEFKMTKGIEKKMTKKLMELLKSQFDSVVEGDIEYAVDQETAFTYQWSGAYKGRRWAVYIEKSSGIIGGYVR